MPNERVQTEVISPDNCCLVGHCLLPVGYRCSLLGSLCMTKSTDSQVGFPTCSLALFSKRSSRLACQTTLSKVQEEQPNQLERHVLGAGAEIHLGIFDSNWIQESSVSEI